MTSVEVSGGHAFRQGYLNRQISPLLEPEQDLKTFLSRLETAGTNLSTLGNVKYQLDLDQRPTLSEDLYIKATVYLEQAQKTSAWLKTITKDDVAGQYNAGTIIRNAFGGAEQVSLVASGGLAPRPFKQMAIGFETPLYQSVAFNLRGSWASKQLPWASHSQETLAATASLLVRPAVGQCELGLETGTRNVHSIKSSASDSVRLGAGQSGKTCAFARYSLDETESEAGYIVNGLKASMTAEKAFALGSNNGLGLPADVEFTRAVARGLYAKSLDNVHNRLVVNIGGTVGALWCQGGSSIVDRFFVGDDMRQYGYQFNGTGPRDVDDAIGGDALVGANVSVYGKLPRLPLDSPLRFKLAFGGASLAVDGGSNNPFSQVLNTRPSTGGAAGIVYKTDSVDFELMYGVPLSSQPSDWGKRGFQFGVGISMR